MWELKHGGVPPARTHHAAAYDGARGKLVLFGGLATSDLDDTWEWDGCFWKQIFPATKPSARKYHLLVYDSARGHVLLYGVKETAVSSATSGRGMAKTGRN